MGCNHSTKKSKGKKGEKTQRGVKHHDGGGNVEKQYDWQVRVLKEVLSANGMQERAELLKGHAHGELCSLVQSIVDKIKTETAAELNVVQEQRNQRTAQEHHRNIEELQKRHDEESGVLKEQVDVLGCELKEFQQLKKRVQQSSFKKDLQRNIPAHGNRGEFWEKEFESLLIVIEMKSERVREQEIKLQHMAALVEKNQALGDQIDNVIKQNEDLTVRINNNQTVIKQQITEQQALQVALERQTAANQALCQEKEELLFKLRHRDPCQDLQCPLVVTHITSR